MYRKALFFIIAITMSYAPAAKDSIALSAPSSLSVDMGQGCSIRVDDPFHGHLASGMPLNASYWTDKPPIKTQMDQFSINVVCSVGITPVSQEKLAERYGANYDAKKKKWAPYFGDVSERDAALLRPVTNVGALNAVNGHGFYLLQDDTDGDLAKRTRSLTYCLFHDAKALCGHGQIMKLSDPKGDLLPYALAILRSIEFIDTPIPDSVSAKP